MQRWWSSGFVVLAALWSSSGCGEGDGPFRFQTVVNDFTDDDVELVVDGEPFQTMQQTQFLKVLTFDSYAEGRDATVVVETRRGDQMLDRCVLYAGACGDECIPERETAGICIFTDGTIAMNEWDCGCDDATSDIGCIGGCELTGPQ